MQQENKQENRELNKDFTTMVKAIELAQEAGGVYKIQDAAVIMLAMENLGRFIQKANNLMEEEQAKLKKEMEAAEPVEKATPAPAKKTAPKKKDTAK